MLGMGHKTTLNNGDATRDNPAPQIMLTELNGNPIELSSLKGKPVFMNFWATWCPPCVAEMPFINELYPEYKDKVHGGRWDWIDFGLTVAGAMIGQLIEGTLIWNN